MPGVVYRNSIRGSSTNLRFDFSGVALFQEYLAGQASASQVLAHPAYQPVLAHARLFGAGLMPADLEAARQGERSPFYGLEAIDTHQEAIHRLLETLRQEQNAWLQTAERTLSALLPEESLDIPIYPILGYDMGIGLAGAVCMNCNCRSYLDQPQEFLFYLVHESTHVIYARSHRLPGLQEIRTPAEWRAYFDLWLQYEGYAVYAPLALRQKRDGLGERDYQVLVDPEQLEAHRRALLTAWQTLQSDIPLSREQYLEICFGEQRLTYRMGCELIRRIARDYGLQAVRRAFYLSGEAFVAQYGDLLH